MWQIPFNRPRIDERAIERVSEVAVSSRLSGNGPYTRRCQELLERQLAARRVLITHSCTAALEMAAILCDLGPGDEVIMPS